MGSNIFGRAASINLADGNGLPRSSQLVTVHGMDLQREKFIAATKELVETLTRVVEAGRKEFSRIGGYHFSFIVPPSHSTQEAKGIRQIMEPTWKGYWKWFKTVGVSSRSEMEQLWNSFGTDDKDVLGCVEQLHAAEAQYNELTAEADADVQKEEDKVRLGITLL